MKVQCAADKTVDVWMNMVWISDFGFSGGNNNVDRHLSSLTAFDNLIKINEAQAGVFKILYLSSRLIFPALETMRRHFRIRLAQISTDS